MDILKAIKEQIEEINKLSSRVSLDAVLTHIERAEHFYKLGKKNRDDHYFTDVVYRTNQAFEGSLRQAYMILADQTEEKSIKKRTVDIEDFLESKSIFNERVLHHFKNYRQDWRNKSTHDFKLFFGESEAFLAIVNVSAYSYVLLNQIIQKLAYQLEQEKLKKEKGKRKLLNEIVENKDISLLTKVERLIQEFSINNELHKPDLKEIELIGMFTAFVESASSKISVDSEAYFQLGKQRFRIDLVVTMRDEKVIIEVKRPSIKFEESYKNQLLLYLFAASVVGIKKGILWLPSIPSKEDDINILREVIEKDGEKYHISIIGK